MKAILVLALTLLFAAPLPGAEDRGATAQAVTYRSKKEPVKAFLCRPAGKGPFPALVVIHGDFGLTTWVKQQARRLAGKGFVILAVDLYRGAVPKDLMAAHIQGRAIPDEQVQADLKAAVDYLEGRSDVHREALGILGWGMGGGYALDGALQDSRLRAVVICYGRLTTDARLLKPLRAPVLGIFGGKDEGIPARTIDQFQAALRRAGKPPARVHVYPACGHGFLDPSETTEAAPPDRDIADAWKRIDRFLAAQFPR